MDDHPIVLQTPPSEMLKRAYSFAYTLEERHPGWSNDQILSSVRESMEHGDFGDMRGFFPIVPVQQTPHHVRRTSADHYPSPPEMVSLSEYTPPPGPLFTRSFNDDHNATINPTTLNTFNSAFNYTHALNSDIEPEGIYAYDSYHRPALMQARPWSYSREGHWDTL
jgi:hypothetical protein